MKRLPPVDWVHRLSGSTAILYCPVDQYDSPEAIDADASVLSAFDRIVVHCDRLRPHFTSYAHVEFLDHHVKFATPPRTHYRSEGPILWVGVRSNLPALAAWVNTNPLPGELIVLSNFEDAARLPVPVDLGFRRGLNIRVEPWSPERQAELTVSCRAALDIKGKDFRSRHKPPAKAVDFLASGVPFAVNPGSSPAEYLAGLGFEVASPLDVDRWLSREYWEECRHVGRTLRRRLTRPKVAARLLKIIDGALKERSERQLVSASVRSTELPALTRHSATRRDPSGAAPLRLFGLMITKDDHDVFADWCRDQLPLYDAVVCLDGSESAATAQIAARYAGRLHYLHERGFAIPYKTDHGLRGVAHDEIVRRFGTGHWVMCCHPDEFCYHDPRRAAARAAAEGCDLVSWYTPHFYPHPDDLADWDRRRHRPVTERFAHYHWDFGGDGQPWLEHRLYRAGDGVHWDDATHGSVRPHGLARPAPFHPTLRHYKVIVTDPAGYEPSDRHAHYRHHWRGLAHRTGLPFPVRRFDDLFVTSLPGYERCDRFNGTFDHPWNMGEEFRPGGAALDSPGGDPTAWHARAWELAAFGRYEEARAALERVARIATDPRVRAIMHNDIAALDATGDPGGARTGFRSALAIDPQCAPAARNLEVLDAALGATAAPPSADAAAARLAGEPSSAPREPPVRVAVVSFLFNWPSTGGGIVHTVELCRYLGEAGYDVRHVHARYDPWEVGRVAGSLPFASACLAFAEPDWNLTAILDRFRRAVDAFDPDYVIVTDSWNVKPLLADAFRGRRVILRLQAMECLCPLNNVRLLPGPGGTARQCPKHQLATPDDCRLCLAEFGGTSGGLHRAERDLCGVGTPGYDAALRRAFRDAHAVLVVNPLTEALVSPHCWAVKVVTAGMDPARFPWPWPDDPAEPPGGRALRLLFAGLTGEWMKGFHVLHDACARLWRTRQDFELLATADPPGPADEFTRNVGWLSQDELPRQIRAADVLVMPTIAQEGLGRTAVEAMACGRPVVASRIGGLTATVLDGATGLLFEPGDAADLGRKLAELLDDAGLRRRLGEAGRRRFEEYYSWPVIVERHYRPLLAPFRRTPGPVPAAAPAARPAGAGYAPVIPDRVDQARLQDDVAELLGVPTARAMALYRGYRALHDREGYAARLGEYKTLSFEEAYVLYALVAERRPAALAEVGTQHGKSTRRILDMRAALGLDAPLRCFDVADALEYVGRDEVELTVGDVTGRFRAAVFDARPPGMVFLDVHAHALLREAVAEVLADRRGWALAVHDCGPGLCNPHMALAKDDPGVSSSTGVWERHVLAEAFVVADPLDPALDRAETATHRLRVFATQHGLAVIVPKGGRPGA